MSDSELASTRSCWGQLAGRSGMEVEDEDEVEDEGEEKQDNGKGKEKVKKDKVGKEGKEEVQKDKRGKGKNGKGKGRGQKKVSGPDASQQSEGLPDAKRARSAAGDGVEAVDPRNAFLADCIDLEVPQDLQPSRGEVDESQAVEEPPVLPTPEDILCFCCGQVGKQSR